MERLPKDKPVAVKPRNLLPAYIGCHKKEIARIAKSISEGDVLSTEDMNTLLGEAKSKSKPNPLLTLAIRGEMIWQ